MIQTSKGFFDSEDEFAVLVENNNDVLRHIIDVYDSMIFISLLQSIIQKGLAYKCRKDNIIFPHLYASPFNMIIYVLTPQFHPLREAVR